MILDEFEFELSNKIKYQSPRGEEESNILLLKPPLPKHERTVTKLQQKFARVVAESARKNREYESRNQSTKEKDQNVPASEDKKSPAPSEVIIVLQQSDIDFYDFKEDFYGMISNGLCFIGDNVKATKDLLNKMSFDDKDKLLGEYFVNFMMPSWMKQTE